jgi:hypothetical protein
MVKLNNNTMNRNKKRTKEYSYKRDNSNFDVSRPEEKRSQFFTYSDKAFCKGVYFLHRQGNIVYVGMSTVNCMERILRHYNEGVKDFDSFSVRRLESLSDKQVVEHEVFLIKKHTPEYNIVHNK